MQSINIMNKIYHITVTVFALVSIALVIIDLCGIRDITQPPYYYIDTGILIFFTVDYSLRFFAADDRKKFFKENIFDLIAIIPYNSIFTAFRMFRVFRVLRLTKLAKAARLLRAAAFFGVVRKKIVSILKTNGFIYVLYASIVLVLISSVMIMFAENMTFRDALWWSIVTCTTVGYGDISPATSVGRIVAVTLMMFGIGLIGMLTGAITTYFTSPDKENKEIVADDDELETLISQMNSEQRQKLTEIARIIIK